MTEPASDELVNEMEHASKQSHVLTQFSTWKRDILRLIARIRQQDVTLRIHDAEVDLLDERIAERDAEIERLRTAIGEAIITLDNYADPTGYVDGNGEQLNADAEGHQGLLARDTATKLLETLRGGEA